MKPLFLALGVLVFAGAAPAYAAQEAPTPPAAAPGPTASATGYEGQACGADAQAQASHRRDAESYGEMINRLANAANAMSVAQAQRNGVRIVQTAPAVPYVTPELTRAIEHALNCGEQRQAAAATDQAIAAPVGTTVRWTSETRPNVSGSSTVTATETAGVDGSQCLTVTDIIIVDGEETRAPKRMCRIPPSNRYVRV